MSTSAHVAVAIAITRAAAGDAGHALARCRAAPRRCRRTPCRGCPSGSPSGVSVEAFHDCGCEVEVRVAELHALVDHRDRSSTGRHGRSARRAAPRCAAVPTGPRTSGRRARTAPAGGRHPPQVSGDRYGMVLEARRGQLGRDPVRDPGFGGAGASTRKAARPRSRPERSLSSTTPEGSSSPAASSAGCGMYSRVGSTAYSPRSPSGPRSGRYRRTHPRDEIALLETGEHVVRHRGAVVPAHPPQAIGAVDRERGALRLRLRGRQPEVGEQRRAGVVRARIPPADRDPARFERAAPGVRMIDDFRKRSDVSFVLHGHSFWGPVTCRRRLGRPLIRVPAPTCESATRC